MIDGNETENTYQQGYRDGVVDALLTFLHTSRSEMSLPGADGVAEVRKRALARVVSWFGDRVDEGGRHA